MNGPLLILAYLAALNPPRVRLAVPEVDTSRAHAPLLLAGSALAFGAVAALAGWSAPLLDALEVTPETFRIGAGSVGILAGLRVLALPRPAREPLPEGPVRMLWPVAIPLLLSPEVVILAVATGTQEGVPATLAGFAVALGVLTSVGALRREPLPERVLLWTGRILGALLVVVAVWLLIDGIRDV